MALNKAIKYEKKYILKFFPKIEISTKLFQNKT